MREYSGKRRTKNGDAESPTFVAEGKGLRHHHVRGSAHYRLPERRAHAGPTEASAQQCLHVGSNDLTVSFFAGHQVRLPTHLTIPRTPPVCCTVRAKPGAVIPYFRRTRRWGAV